jgi:hypothetical protein
MGAVEPAAGVGLVGGDLNNELRDVVVVGVGSLAAHGDRDHRDQRLLQRVTAGGEPAA